MSLLVIGLSHHRSSVEVLERVALSPAGAGNLAALTAASPDVAESVVVSTCNRTEIYAEVTAFHGAVGDLTDALVDATALAREDLKDHLDFHYGEAAVAHVFNVAAGLDSMAVGESQILGQLRESLALAQRNGHVGPRLNSLIQHALKAGKRVHTETGIDEISRSLIGAGLDLAEARLGPLSEARVLVIGAGAMSALSATTAHRRGPADLAIVNRTPERGSALAARLGARALSFEALPAALAEADVVISCTGAAGAVVRLADVADALVARSGRPQVYLDLALPHDIEPSVAALRGVTRLGLDDLGAHTSSPDGSPELDRARSIIAEESARHATDRAAATAAPTVRALREAAHAVMDRELQRLEQRTPGMSDRDREEVRLATHRMVEKLLHRPTVRVKELAVDGRIGEYDDAIRQLFDLTELREHDLREHDLGGHDLGGHDLGGRSRRHDRRGEDLRDGGNS